MTALPRQMHTHKDGKTSWATILVVEDEVLTALDLQSRLQDAGYSVVGPAATVSEASELFRHQIPAIALLDANLGGEFSYMLALDLQAAGVEIVFHTGYHELEDLPSALHDCTVLSKPLGEGELLKEIAAAVNRRYA